MVLERWVGEGLEGGREKHGFVVWVGDEEDYALVAQRRWNGWEGC